MAIVTRTQRRFSWTAVLILALAGMLAIPALAAHGPDKLDFHQPQFLGLTAAEAVEAGATNEPDGCGVELAPGEVGWAFLVAGNANSNFLTHVTAFFSGGMQDWSLTNDGDATRVRVQQGNVTLVAFTAGSNETLDAIDAWGQQNQNRFQLTHVCVADEPEGSILIQKEYEVEPLEGQISEFTVFDNGTSVGIMDATIVDDTTVLYCLDELAFGNYRVSETFTPDGFAPADDVIVTVDEESTCAERLAEPDPDVDATIENPADNRNLTVEKLKLSHDGDDFVETNLGLAGFEFSLYEGTDDSGTFIASSTTGGDGLTDFDDGILEVGTTYTVCETGVPHPGYWTDSDCQTFTAELNEDVDLTFFNAPKADIEIGFVDVTGFTSANVICVDADGNEVLNESWSSTDDATIPALDLGNYSCDIEIRNGAVNDD